MLSNLFWKKWEIFLVKYVWPIWWSEALGEMEARKYSDKFMFLVNLLDPTSLSQVIFPQNMRNLSERYFARVYKLKLRFLHKCHSTWGASHQASQRNTDNLALNACHITSSRLPFSGLDISFQYSSIIILDIHNMFWAMSMRFKIRQI